MTATVTPALNDVLVAAVTREPGSTARELAADLRRSGHDIEKRRVNSVLYSEGGTFRHDGGRVPRWFLLSDAARPEAALTTLMRSRRSAQDAAFLQNAAEDMPDSGQAETVLAQPSLPRFAQPALDWSSCASTLELRPWQQDAFAAWCSEGGTGVVEAVTGTGKTHVGVEAAIRAAEHGVRTTVLVPSVELQRQWRRQFQVLAPELSVATVGGEAFGSPARADVAIALVHTASRRDLTGVGPRMELLVADEVHRYGSAAWCAALRPNYRFRLGLTATFERSNDDAITEMLEPYFGRAVFKYDYTRAVLDGVVAPFTLAFVGVSLSEEEQTAYDQLSRRLSRAGATLAAAGLLCGDQGGHRAQLAAARGRGGTIARAAFDYDDAARRRRGILAECGSKAGAVAAVSQLIVESRGAVVFTQKVDPAENVAAVLRSRDVVAAAVHSGMDADERRANLEGLEDGSVMALCAPKILDEGIDIPEVDLGIVVSASRGRRQMIQRLGRVIRLKADGRHARFIILFARGTVEDPASGRLEDFVSMVERVAARTSVLADGWDVTQVRAALELTEPSAARRPKVLQTSFG